MLSRPCEASRGRNNAGLPQVLCTNTKISLNEALRTAPPAILIIYKLPQTESTIANTTASGMLEVNGEASAAREEGRQTRVPVNPDCTNSSCHTSDKSPTPTWKGKNHESRQSALGRDGRDFTYRE